MLRCCCFLNSKLLLFDFIHRMLLELLLNVKNCVRCWRGGRLTLPAVMEVTLAGNAAARVHMMAGALAKLHHCEAWAWWWGGLSFARNRFPALATAATSRLPEPPGRGMSPGITVL